MSRGPSRLTAACGRGSPALGAYAAAPVFAFWLSIVTLIWLYILGLSNFAAGTYSLEERALTVVIGASGLLGIITAARHDKLLRVGQAILVAGAFAVLQLAVMWISFHPAVSG